MVPDEFGYWASAAKNVGYDWSEVASLGSYYSFGYSFILTPILWLFRDGVMAYRAAVTVNMILMCVSMFLIFGIIKRLFPEIDQTKQTFIGGIAVFYPAWVFNMQMTMAEALLMFLFVLVTYLFICLIQKRKVTTAVLLVVSLAYIYSVHMRTVGVLIACAITLLLWMFLEHPRVKMILVFVGGLLIFATGIAIMKQNTVVEVFSSADSQVLAGNDYGSQWGKFQQIFTVCGIVQFIKEVVGKVFYLGLASFGIFYWGMGWAIKRSLSLFRNIRKKRKVEEIEWIALFLMLAMVGEILIGSIFMYGSKAIDTLIYGRYDEFLMPVFLLIGIVAMSKSRWLFRETLILGVGTGLMIPMLLNVIKVGKKDGLRGYMVAGISYLLKEDKLDVCHFFKDTWILCFVIMILTAFLVWLSEKGRNLVWLLTGVIIIEITAGLQISNHYTYRVNSSNFMDLLIADEIIDNAEERDVVVYLNEGRHQYIDFIQMQLGARSIKIISEDKLNDLKQEINSVFVIAHTDTIYKDQLEEMFDKCVRANTFYLYYNGKDAV